jgi:hypothetical protein
MIFFCKSNQIILLARNSGEKDLRKITDTCIKRWGLRASSLSAVTKADAEQKHSCYHLNPNVLYMMLGTVFIQSFLNYIQSFLCLSMGYK